MKKLLIGILTLASSLHAQNLPGGPANVAGTLYASNFANWTVPQGNNGPLSWSFGTACSSATSGGVTFKPFMVGSPIRIVDSNPSLSETVTVTSVKTAGSGCLINVSPSNPHQNFYLATGTAGLQEAINFAGSQAYTVIVTPDFTRMGGETSTITSAVPNPNVTILDERTSVVVPYVLAGDPQIYTAQPFGSGGTPIPPSIPVLASNSEGVAQVANAVGVASLFCGTTGGFLKSDGTCGAAANVPTPAFAIPWINPLATAFQTDGTYNFSPDTSTVDASNTSMVDFNRTATSSVQHNGVSSTLNLFSSYQSANTPNISEINQTMNVTGPAGINYGPAAQVTGNLWTLAAPEFTTLAIYKEGNHGFIGGSIRKFSPGDLHPFTCQPCVWRGGMTGNSDQGFTPINIDGTEDPSMYNGTITTGTAQGATFINNTVGVNGQDGFTGSGNYIVNMTQTISGGDFTAAPVLTDGIFFAAPLEKFSEVAPYPLTDIIPSTAAGLLACPGGIPQLTDETVLQSVTCTATAMAGAPAPNFQTGMAALDAGNPDAVNITAVATISPGVSQSVTFQYRHPNFTAWAPNGSFPDTNVGWVWDGTNVQVVVTPGITGSTAPTWNHTMGGTTNDGTVVWSNNGLTVPPASLWQGGNVMNTAMIPYAYVGIYGAMSNYPCYGATDAFHIVCSVNLGGTETTFPTNRQPPLNVLNITSTGGNVTALVDFSTSQNPFAYNNLQVGVVTGCSDSNINGAANTVILNTLTSTVTWTQSNTGTYSCASATVNPAQFYSQFILSPAVEQISGPALDANGNGNPLPGIELTINDKTFNTGDAIAQYHQSTFGGTLLGYAGRILNPDARMSGIVLFPSGAGVNANWNVINYQNQNPASFYIGGGGTSTLPTIFNTPGPNGGLWSGTLPFLGHAAFTFFAPNDFSVDNCQAESLFDINKDFNNHNGNMSFYGCAQEWDFTNSLFSPKIDANFITLNNEVYPGSDSFGPVGFSALSNNALPNYVGIGNGTRGDVSGQLGAGQIGAGLLTSGASGPPIFQIAVIGGVGSTTGCFEATAVTSEGESTPGASDCSSLLPASPSSSNYTILNFFPTLGANSFKAYKQDTDGTYKLLCSVNVQQLAQELCRDTGQALGAAAPTVDNSGLLNMLNGKMQARGQSYIWPGSEAAGCLTNDGSGNLTWGTCSGGGGSGFPITLGTTAIASGSTTTSLAGLAVNGVTLTTGGSSTTFLNAAGAYTTPAGGGGTIPNISNLLIGGASNTAADSGIAPANVGLLSGTQTWTGVNSFPAGTHFTASGSNAPFVVDSTVQVANLNATFVNNLSAADICHNDGTNCQPWALLTNANTWTMPQTVPSLVLDGTGIPIASGTTSNSDLGGYVTLSSGTGTQTLTASYSHIPIVQCVDTSATPTVVGCHATLSGSTVTITFNGTGSDVISYATIGMQ